MTDIPRINMQDARLAKRYRAERRFRAYGIAAIVLALGVLAAMLISIVVTGHSAFRQSRLMLDIYYDPQILDPDGTKLPATLATADYQALARASLRELFPEVTARGELRSLSALLSRGAGNQLRNNVLENPELIGTRQTVAVLVADDVDLLVKGKFISSGTEATRQLNDKQVVWSLHLVDRGLLSLDFNTAFFTHGDSREPELAGILGSAVGSFYTLLICMAISFPVGVMAAIYLQEFAAKNRFTDLIEVNISNLAAVPSIVFGLLGLAVFLNFLELPRSAPVVGGMVLALLTLPTIIIASRAALLAVPPSIREAALAIGASKMQTVLHHVLPLGLPGMLTGAIIGMARALGETAPLLMIGMVAFIVDVPQSMVDPATALPVQIYLWADSPERAFTEKMAAGIMVLLAFLITMNLTAVVLRQRFERKW